MQEKAYRQDRPFPPPYEIRLTQHKGRGIFATKPLPLGTLIIEEYAYTVDEEFQACADSSEETWTIVHSDDEILQTVENFALQMSPLNRSRLDMLPTHLTLNKPQDTERRYMINQILSNKIQLVNVDGNCYSAFGPTTSILNHACIPNSYCGLLEVVLTAGIKRRIIFVQALQTIKPGEEITIRYMPCNWSRDERRKLLEENAHFFCLCDVCVSNGLASRKLGEIGAFERDINKEIF